MRWLKTGRRNSITIGVHAPGTLAPRMAETAVLGVGAGQGRHLPSGGPVRGFEILDANSCLLAHFQPEN